METGTLKELNVQPGDVVRWMETSKDRTIAGWVDGRCYCTEQKFGGWESMRADCQWTLVSRATPAVDLTALEKPFGLLDPATQEALRAHGGPYERFDGGQWVPATFGTMLYLAQAYRVKPAPARETVTQDMGITTYGGVYPAGDPEDTPVRITFDRVDGQIDLSTYRVEARQ